MERGSDKLGHLRKGEITEEQLERLASLRDIEGIRLVDWHVKGTPAVDWVSGSFHAQPSAIAALIDNLIKDGAIRHVDVFPYGLPAVDLVEVRFASQRAGG